MKILIATGIYPPELGGPAEYAKNLSEVWKKQGHSVSVRVFSKFKKLPPGLRHLAYFFYVTPKTFSADFVLILDTFSCALPAILACKLFGKKSVLRTGGDFLWEAYTERTNDLVLLRNFYATRIGKLSLKEKIIFWSIKFVLRNTDAVIWSTEWQRNIFMVPYGLLKQRNFVVENFYGPRVSAIAPKSKNFIAASRPNKWKNLKRLKEVFGMKDVRQSGASLDTENLPHAAFLQKIRESYAVLIASLGDISPNTILDAIKFQKPFIVTKETGLFERIKEAAIFVDPENSDDIAEKVLWLSDGQNYEEQKKKLQNFSFTHTWEEIAAEYMDIFNSIKNI